jgi:hypothetical protein
MVYKTRLFCYTNIRIDMRDLRGRVCLRETADAIKHSEPTDAMHCEKLQPEKQTNVFLSLVVWFD